MAGCRRIIIGIFVLLAISTYWDLIQERISLVASFSNIKVGSEKDPISLENILREAAARLDGTGEKIAQSHSNVSGGALVNADTMKYITSLNSSNNSVGEGSSSTTNTTLLNTKEPTNKDNKETTKEEMEPAKEDKNDDIFDPTMSLEDYRAKANEEPASRPRPSRKWLAECAAHLKNDSTIVKPMPVLRRQYALGDCLIFCNKCNVGLPGGRFTWHPNFQRMEPGVYNLTIAGYYNELACPNNTEDLNIVDQVLEDFHHRDGFIKPDATDIVIHLRLGDVVDRVNKGVDSFLTKGAIADHPRSRIARMKSLLSVYDYLDVLDAHPDANVKIVGGTHKPIFFSKGRVYANCLQRGLAKATGRNVELFLDGGDADKDFYYMSYAKKLMISTGGFSRMIGRMARKHGGEVLGERFEPACGPKVKKVEYDGCP